jgi:hypothetical protein
MEIVSHKGCSLRPPWISNCTTTQLEDAVKFESVDLESWDRQNATETLASR